MLGLGVAISFTVSSLVSSATLGGVTLQSFPAAINFKYSRLFVHLLPIFNILQALVGTKTIRLRHTSTMWLRSAFVA